MISIKCSIWESWQNIMFPNPGTAASNTFFFKVDTSNVIFHAGVWLVMHQWTDYNQTLFLTTEFHSESKNQLFWLLKYKENQISQYFITISYYWQPCLNMKELIFFCQEKHFCVGQAKYLISYFNGIRVM
jgi:hypothetical protein